MSLCKAGPLRDPEGKATIFRLFFGLFDKIEENVLTANKKNGGRGPKK